MPKRAKKGRSSAIRIDGSGGSDDDSVFNDAVSVISNVSSGSQFIRDEAAASNVDGAGTVDELSQDEVYEEKLREAIDLASQKSAQGRTMALESLCTAFIKKYVADFVDNRRATLCDIVERALKKGKPAEQVAACRLAVLICIQLGESEVAEEFVKELRTVLITTMNDRSVAFKARTSAAFALGDCSFLASSAEDFSPLMTSHLEKIFSERGGPNAPEDFCDLQTAALTSWTLLYTLMSSSAALDALENHLEVFERQLGASSVDLRIATGEAVAVLYESAVGHDEDAAYDLVETLLPRLQELSKDSHKFRSKKDRKEQKSSFRDIVKTIEDGDEFYEKVVFSKREILEITSWSMKKQYDQICKALASGTNMHLAENELVRDIFGLGPPLPSLSRHQSTRQSKNERQHANQMAFKWRTQTRGKHRDKRSSVI